jgi:thymidylate kinase
MAIEQMLLDVFKVLYEAKVPYCLLRGYDELAEKASKKEIDILVDSQHLERFEGQVAELGFVSLPSWGYAPHCFFIGYDKINDTWLKLDVVTDTVYGKPVRHMHLNLAKQCLADRIQHNGLYVLDPAKEFITLLLHCILDKGKIQSKHRRRLNSLGRTLAKETRNYRWAIDYLRQYLPVKIKRQAIVQALEQGDWSWLMNHHSTVARKLFWQEPFRNTLHLAITGILRRIRPLLFVLKRRGIAVALLAPDGAGKSTLAQELSRTDYLRARLIYMGSNRDASNVDLPTTRWLKERVKSLNRSGWTPQRSIFKGLHFSNRMVEQWYRYSVGWYHRMLGRFVIFDRYTYDSYLAPPAETLVRRLRQWLLKHACPPPNIVFLLDAPGDILYLRKQEHSPEHLEKQRQTFLRLKDKISNMVVVDATRSLKEVRGELISKMWKYYGHRCHKMEVNGKHHEYRSGPRPSP